MADRGARFEALIQRAIAEARIPSIAELGRRSGVTHNTWYRWFKGEQPRRSTLYRAADVLGLTVDQLMDPWENGPRMVTLTEAQLEAIAVRAAELALAGATPNRQPPGRRAIQRVRTALDARQEAKGAPVEGSESAAPPPQRRQP